MKNLKKIIDFILGLIVILIVIGIILVPTIIGIITGNHWYNLLYFVWWVPMSFIYGLFTVMMNAAKDINKDPKVY